MAKYLKNPVTGVEVRPNGVDLINNQIRTENGEMLSYPAAWTDNETVIHQMDDKAIDYLSTTKDFEGWIVVEETT